MNFKDAIYQRLRSMLSTLGGIPPAVEVPTNLDHEILKILALIEAQLSQPGSASELNFAEFPLLPLEGLTLSRQSPTDLRIAPGRALLSTSSGRSMAILNSEFSKHINASWTPGSGNGGRFEASPFTASETVHVFLMRDSSGSVDIGFDRSMSAANAPAGYTTRRIGSLVMNASGNLPFFLQRRDTIYYRQPPDDYFSSTIPTSIDHAVLISVPLAPLIAIVSLVNTSPAGNGSVLLRSPLMLPDSSYARSTRSLNTLLAEIPTDSAQVRLYADQSGQAAALFTIGYHQLL